MLDHLPIGVGEKHTHANRCWSNAVDEDGDVVQCQGTTTHDLRLCAKHHEDILGRPIPEAESERQGRSSTSEEASLGEQLELPEEFLAGWR